MATNKTSRSFCFTSFKDKISFDDELFRYMIWGEERCPKTGKSHLQGYVELHKPQRLKRVQKALGDEKAHLEKRRGTREEARQYCMKDGVYTERGSWERGGQGTRNDWEDVKEALKADTPDIQIFEKWPALYAQCHKAIDKIRGLLRKEKMLEKLNKAYESVGLYEWQEQLVTELEKQNNRQVLWVHERVGGAGKSFLAKYLMVTEGAFYCQNGKTADIAHAYNYEPIVVFDLTRSQEEIFNYSMLESFKNGMLFSPKYDSCMKVFDSAKVVVFANFEPDYSKLSVDRWDIRSLNENKKLVREPLYP